MAGNYRAGGSPPSVIDDNPAGCSGVKHHRCIVSTSCRNFSSHKRANLYRRDRRLDTSSNSYRADLVAVSAIPARCLTDCFLVSPNNFFDSSYLKFPEFLERGKLYRSIDINLENDFIKFLGQSGSAKESKLEATDIELMVERVEYLYARRENVPASNWGK